MAKASTCRPLRATATASLPRASYPNWLDYAGYTGMHLACLGVFWTGVSPADLALCAGIYAVSAFGVSVGWHRYLAHRAFKTSRRLQFLLVLMGTFSWMKGGLWFAHHHGHHHRVADQPADVHSPVAQGFLHAHSGWFLDPRHRATDYRRVARWTRYPELVWLNERGWLLALLTAVAIWLAFGWSGLVWGFFVSTILVWHSFQSIGSFCHGYGGTRRYPTPDNSRNNLLVTLLTFGEGWHNNHHFFPYSAKLGVAWWEVDPGWWAIWLLERLGLVWDVQRPRPRDARRERTAAGLRRELQRLLHEGLPADDPRHAMLSTLQADFASGCAALLRHRPLHLCRATAGFRRELRQLFADDPALARRLNDAVVQWSREGALAHLLLRKRAAVPLTRRGAAEAGAR